MVLASLNGKVQGASVHFPATTLQISALWPTGAGELSGADPQAGLFCLEPTSSENSCVPFKNNGKRP